MEKKHLLIAKLKGLAPGKRILFDCVKLKTVLSHNGCEGCAFDTEEKANGCFFKMACMAHYRKDRQSVIFTSGKQKRL
jgi:hypothetical protein